MEKAEYKSAVKQARKDLRLNLSTSMKHYRREVKKYELFYKQSCIKDELKEMGVVNRQIPVTIIDTPAKRIKVNTIASATKGA